MSPRKRELCWNNIRWRPVTSSRRQRHHGANPPIDFRRGERCPTAETVPHDSNRSGIEVRFPIPRYVIQQVIEEKAHIRHTVGDPTFHPCSLLRAGLPLLAHQDRKSVV